MPTLTRHSGLLRLIPWSLAIFLCLVLLYYSFKPEPQFSGDPFLPGWVQWFGDTFPDFRTFVPYFCFAALGPFLMGRKHQGLPVSATLWIAIGLEIFLFLSEWIQVYLPQRSATWMDVFWGTAGIVAGAVSGIGAWKMWSNTGDSDSNARIEENPNSTKTVKSPSESHPE